ncbi:Peroxidase [Sarcoptes scabiei]|nr:Peroxidase [Sarcoptes scabiei]
MVPYQISFIKFLLIVHILINANVFVKIVMIPTSFNMNGQSIEYLDLDHNATISSRMINSFNIPSMASPPPLPSSPSSSLYTSSGLSLFPSSMKFSPPRSQSPTLSFLSLPSSSLMSSHPIRLSTSASKPIDPLLFAPPINNGIGPLFLSFGLGYFLFRLLTMGLILMEKTSLPYAHYYSRFDYAGQEDGDHNPPQFDPLLLRSLSKSLSKDSLFVNDNHNHHRNTIDRILKKLFKSNPKQYGTDFYDKNEPNAENRNNIHTQSSQSK